MFFKGLLWRKKPFAHPAFLCDFSLFMFFLVVAAMVLLPLLAVGLGWFLGVEKDTT